MKNLLIASMLFTSLISCEFDYKSTMASRTRQRTYVAEKIYDKNSNKTQILPPDIKQLLVFDRDTMMIIRNDTIIEKLTSYDPENWVGKRKYGKVLFDGLSKEGRKFFLIEIKEPKNAVDGELVVGSIMKGEYDAEKDTIQTFYKPFP